MIYETIRKIFIIPLKVVWIVMILLASPAILLIIFALCKDSEEFKESCVSLIYLK